MSGRLAEWIETTTDQLERLGTKPETAHQEPQGMTLDKYRQDIWRLNGMLMKQQDSQKKVVIYSTADKTDSSSEKS